MRIQLTLLTLGLALVFLSGNLSGDEQPKQEPPKATAKEANPKPSAAAVLLSLPAELTADPEDGWVEVEATLNGEGEVRWMVSPRVKTKIVGNSLMVATTKPGTITVTAIALVGGKLSPFVSTNISVSGGSSPPPKPTPPGPGPVSPPVSSELFVSVIVDPALATMAEQQLALSPTLRNAVKAGGGTYNAFASTDPILQPASQQNPKGLGLIAWYKNTGSASVLILQNKDGKVLKSIKLPLTEAEVLKVIQGG